jgi:hypothetical protein
MRTKINLNLSVVPATSTTHLYLTHPQVNNLERREGGAAAFGGGVELLRRCVQDEVVDVPDLVNDGLESDNGHSVSGHVDARFHHVGGSGAKVRVLGLVGGQAVVGRRHQVARIGRRFHVRLEQFRFGLAVGIPPDPGMGPIRAVVPVAGVVAPRRNDAADGERVIAVALHNQILGVVRVQRALDANQEEPVVAQLGIHQFPVLALVLQGKSLVKDVHVLDCCQVGGFHHEQVRAQHPSGHGHAKRHPSRALGGDRQFQRLRGIVNVPVHRRAQIGVGGRRQVGGGRPFRKGRFRDPIQISLVVLPAKVLGGRERRGRCGAHNKEQQSLQKKRSTPHSPRRNRTPSHWKLAIVRSPFVTNDDK